ncbi:MAG TPA: hypothetical protein VFV00_10660 [Acidimicrobiales bacterium]|nr:hypothetical protein [Acidimicrobiales bacterium]
MQKQKFSRSRMLISGALVAGVMAVGGYAFTASNTVPNTKAGDGSGTISGYTVSSVHYGLNATNPATLDSVSFNLDSTPASGSHVNAKIDGTWYSCTVPTGTPNTSTCDTTADHPAVSTAASLEVVAAD